MGNTRLKSDTQQRKLVLSEVLKMLKFEREVEKYEVSNGKEIKIEFENVEQAIRFATNQIDKGLDVSIKEINELVGWY